MSRLYIASEEVQTQMSASVRVEILIGLMILLNNATLAEVFGDLFRGLKNAKAVKIGHVMSVLAVS